MAARNDSNARACVPGSKLSRGLLGFVSCLGFCCLLLVSVILGTS